MGAGPHGGRASGSCASESSRASSSAWCCPPAADRALSSSGTSVRELRRNPTTGSYHEAQRHEGLEAIPGVLIARVDGPLFFADADRFRSILEALARQDGTPELVVVDAESIYLTDPDGADILSQVAEELDAQGTALVLAAMHPSVLESWRRGGVIDAIGADAIFETVPDAVRALNGRAASSLDDDEQDLPSYSEP
jgi:sulfate permease, SulP family